MATNRKWWQRMVRKRMIDGLKDNVRLLVVKRYHYIYIGLCL